MSRTPTSVPAEGLVALERLLAFYGDDPNYNPYSVYYESSGNVANENKNSASFSVALNTKNPPAGTPFSPQPADTDREKILKGVFCTEEPSSHGDGIRIRQRGKNKTDPVSATTKFNPPGANNRPQLQPVSAASNISTDSAAVAAPPQCSTQWPLSSVKPVGAFSFVNQQEGNKQEHHVSSRAQHLGGTTQNFCDVAEERSTNLLCYFRHERETDNTCNASEGSDMRLSNQANVSLTIRSDDDDDDHRHNFHLTSDSSRNRDLNSDESFDSFTNDKHSFSVPDSDLDLSSRSLSSTSAGTRRFSSSASSSNGNLLQRYDDQKHFGSEKRMETSHGKGRAGSYSRSMSGASSLKVSAPSSSASGLEAQLTDLTFEQTDFVVAQIYQFQIAQEQAIAHYNSSVEKARGPEDDRQHAFLGEAARPAGENFHPRTRLGISSHGAASLAIPTGVNGNVDNDHSTRLAEDSGAHGTSHFYLQKIPLPSEITFDPSSMVKKEKAFANQSEERHSQRAQHTLDEPYTQERRQISGDLRSAYRNAPPVLRTTCSSGDPPTRFVDWPPGPTPLQIMRGALPPPVSTKFSELSLTVDLKKKALNGKSRKSMRQNAHSETSVAEPTRKVTRFMPPPPPSLQAARVMAVCLPARCAPGGAVPSAPGDVYYTTADGETVAEAKAKALALISEQEARVHKADHKTCRAEGEFAFLTKTPGTSDWSMGYGASYSATVAEGAPGSTFSAFDQKSESFQSYCQILMQWYSRVARVFGHNKVAENDSSASCSSPSRTDQCSNQILYRPRSHLFPIERHPPRFFSHLSVPPCPRPELFFKIDQFAEPECEGGSMLVLDDLKGFIEWHDGVQSWWNNHIRERMIGHQLHVQLFKQNMAFPSGSYEMQKAR